MKYLRSYQLYEQFSSPEYYFMVLSGERSTFLSGEDIRLEYWGIIEAPLLKSIVYMLKGEKYVRDGERSMWKYTHTPNPISLSLEFPNFFYDYEEGSVEEGKKYGTYHYHWTSASKKLFLGHLNEFCRLGDEDEDGPWVEPMEAIQVLFKSRIITYPPPQWEFL